MSGVSFMEKLLDGVVVEWKALGNVLHLRAGQHVSASEIMQVPNEEYAYPCFGGNGVRGFVNKRSHDGEHLLIGRQGALCGNVQRMKGLFYATEHAVVVTASEGINIDWAYHLLVMMNLNQYASKSAQPGLAVGKIQSLQIPIPCPDNPKKSFEIQAEIVRILDTFTAHTAELTAELTARKKQYHYYRDKLLSFEDGEVEWKTLGEVAVIGTGSHDTQDAIDDGEFIFYARGQKPLKLNVFDFDETAIITAGDGAGVGKVFHYAQGKYALHQRAYRIVPGELMEPRFVYHCIASHFYTYIQKASVSSSVTSLRRPMFLNFPIPVPSLIEQARIVAILDKFDALTNSISEGLPREIALRQQQYEYYRDRLLSFPKPDEAAVA